MFNILKRKDENLRDETFVHLYILHGVSTIVHLNFSLTDK
jgi:hypothetical protein